ncbi:T9SS type A sorting domain-containing protein [Cryomorpha ignava]|uniref:T9SS type A sorting domain-containing protein n=1 Tax=Cryomorpha ignava TaxID=101383 RepID=A0A7K3WQE6_9FLAO|nr:Calx-beta domain-containing protein [Cryomorpha ignava]NEN23776.1 T9SS type A sorting domain-containing protein [Cryomorpha ignava]
MKINLLFISLFIFPISLFAQKGPGGVSVETPSQSTCRIWLDASTLTSLADGDDLVDWPDVSLSNVNDKATPLNSSLPPYFRDDAANTINGFPVVVFDDGRFLLMQSTTDLNLATITFTKTVFFAFRTSTDVTSKQVLYEEGGCWRGFNVHIQNGNIHVGAYDLNQSGVNNNGTQTDGDGTPQWGYTYVKTPVQANSTYILSAQFYAQNQGVVNANANYFIKGWLNGLEFDNMELNDGDLTVNGNNGIGSLHFHPNPIGLGAVNDDFVDQTGIFCSNTGSFTFQGRLAEFCYYNDLLSETERIITENYLGSKYFANLINNDKYIHQALYGNDVIGIGQQTNQVGNRHNLSQGRNPFLISENATTANSNHYFLTGHNGGNMVLTGADVPGNSVNIQRLQRTWRVDKTANFGTVKYKVKSTDLPPAPAGFTKLVMLIDSTNANFPNFSLASTVVKEIRLISGVNHEIEFDFQDDSFYTLAWLKPEVEFTFSESSALEADPLPNATTTFSVGVQLNYEPLSATGNTIDYIFVDAGQTAEPADYSYDATDQADGLTILPSQRFATLDFKIVNDDDADDQSTEQFLIILQNGANTTSGLSVGFRDTLVVSILDDDPPPNGSFVSSSGNVSEGAGFYYVKVQRTGDPSDMSSTSSKIRVRRKASPNQGTASYNSDFTLNSADGWKGSIANRVDTVFFPAALVSSQIDSIRVEILDDDINENDETVNLVLEGALDIAIDPSATTNFTLNIIENDPLPQVNFFTNNQTGYESVGDPVIFVELDRPSARDVTVFYTIDVGASTATYDNDYTASTTGSILFQPGDTLKYPTPFNVDNGDVVGEPDETVIFNLTGGINVANGAVSQHTYTILDYSPFEWKGAAGVGKNSDNIVWIDANRMGPLGIKTAINNFSPRDIEINRKGGDNNRAELIANGINGRQSMAFDGIDNSTNADCYQIDDDSFTNLAGYMEKKSFYFVIKPTSVPMGTAGVNSTPSASNCRLLYEQGGGIRGLSIYLYNERVYLHAWNDNNDGPESPWGYDNGASGGNANKVASAVWARSTQNIVANQEYIISCHYNNKSDEPLMVYVNGRKGEMNTNIVNPNDVGRLYGHSGDIGLGAPTNQGRVHYTVNQPGERRCPYEGLLSEFIMYHEPQLTEARRIIIENYLSAKYNIPLYVSDTRQIFDLAFADNLADPSNDFNNEVAGIGRIISAADTAYHGDAQGTAILRIKDPVFTQNTAFLTWGHNGDELINTWPYSYGNASLPSGIQERSGKVWKMFESPNGSVTSADVFINFSASANAPDFNLDNSLLKLLVHSNSDPQNFSNASVYDVSEIRSGNIALFSAVNMSNGMYFALGNTSPISISPLPVELLNFNARLETDYVDITWSTSTEINNDYFIIERADASLNWKELSTVDGAGNSNTTLSYLEKDREPLPGISYYRLKQVDYDGVYKYSDVVSVVNSEMESNEDVFLYPNPSSMGSVFVRIPYAYSRTSTNVSFYNLSGVKVWETKLRSDATLFELKYGDLPMGVYIVELKSDILYDAKKLVIKN